MRSKRSVVLSLDQLTAEVRAESAPIFAVLADEPIFAEIARHAQARFLAYGRLDDAYFTRKLSNTDGAEL